MEGQIQIRYTKKKYQELSLECNIYIDEQIFPFKGKKNVKNKPKKWDIRMYILSIESDITTGIKLFQNSSE